MITAKEVELERKEQLIEVAKEDLSKRIIDFEQTQSKILGCLDENEKKKRQRILQVVEMVSNMKPEKASQLLSVQDSDIAVRIISEIDPARASKIFNLMDKEISARLQKQYLNMKK